MLNGLSGQDSINKSLIQQNELEKVNPNKKNNPYSNIDKNLLIDETSISKEAINLYQKDMDIRKFSMLAMSNPEDLSHNVLTAQNAFGASDAAFDNKIIDGLFDNKRLLMDLFG